MYNSKTYLTNSRCTLLFEKNNFFVIKDDTSKPLGTMWLVSDGNSIISVLEEPKLKVKDLKQLILKYETMKENALQCSDDDESYLLENDPEFKNNKIKTNQ